MAHKTLINGTSYDISGGKTLIGGTAYKITGGRTLIGGTAYAISFTTTPTVTTFKFYIEVDGNHGNAGTYTAKTGMTWAEWCDSSYNSSNIHVNRGELTAGHASSVLDSNGIEQSPTDVIVAGETYTVFD